MRLKPRQFSSAPTPAVVCLLFWSALFSGTARKPVYRIRPRRVLGRCHTGALKTTSYRSVNIAGMSFCTSAVAEVIFCHFSRPFPSQPYHIPPTPTQHISPSVICDDATDAPIINSNDSTISNNSIPRISLLPSVCTCRRRTRRNPLSGISSHPLRACPQFRYRAYCG